MRQPNLSNSDRILTTDMRWLIVLGMSLADDRFCCFFWTDDDDACGSCGSSSQDSEDEFCEATVANCQVNCQGVVCGDWYAPTYGPTRRPSYEPTKRPTYEPTRRPTPRPTRPRPTPSPTTPEPSWSPTRSPYGAPTTAPTDYECNLDKTWHRPGQPSQDCAWAQNSRPRCVTAGWDGRLAYEACCRPCQGPYYPTTRPTVSPTPVPRPSPTTRPTREGPASSKKKTAVSGAVFGIVIALAVLLCGAGVILVILARLLSAPFSNTKARLFSPTRQDKNPFNVSKKGKTAPNHDDDDSDDDDDLDDDDSLDDTYTSSQPPPEQVEPARGSAALWGFANKMDEKTKAANRRASAGRTPASRSRVDRAWVSTEGDQ